MKRSYCKRIAALLLAAAVLFALPALPVSGEPAEESKSVVIFHTNDIHGALAGSGSVIGADLAAALKQRDDAILVDGGDATQGVALASQSQGESVIEIMNAAGYDAMALGNHEFDYGLSQLQKLREMADFPLLSANTVYNGGLLCADENGNGANVLIEKNGIKVGIFALTTADTVSATKPENLVGVEFADEIETAKQQVEELSAAGADVIVALVHMGVLSDSVATTSRALAQAMKDTELDAIIDGHSHTVVNEVVEGTNITLAQTGTGSANIGRMEITLTDTGVSIEEQLLSAADLSDVTPDPAVTAVIDRLNGSLSETLGEVIGENAVSLWGGSVNGKIAEARSGETNLGDLICDSMIAEAKDILPADKQALPVVAIENGGGFRTTVQNGVMTRGSFINCLPFANAVMTKEITPAVLYAALESFVSSVTAQDPETGFLTAGYSGSFPQIGGMRFVYDPNAKEGEKLTELRLADDTLLDRADTDTRLILVSNDYVIGNALFADCPFVAEGRGLTETVMGYVDTLTENGEKPLSLPMTQGRIKTVNHDPNRTYTAHIALTGDTPPASVTVIVDGTALVTGSVTDGLLELTLPDGPHAIRLTLDQAEAYVNNYSGNGIVDEYNGLTLGWPELAYSAAEYEDHTDTELRGAVEATAEKDGYTGDLWCKKCGIKVASGEVIPALGNADDPSSGDTSSDDTSSDQASSDPTSSGANPQSGGGKSPLTGSAGMTLCWAALCLSAVCAAYCTVSDSKKRER